MHLKKEIISSNVLNNVNSDCTFLHIRLAFPLVLPMPEISSGMGGVLDESRAVQWHDKNDVILPL
jgi:hypothetical protein